MDRIELKNSINKVKNILNGYINKLDEYNNIPPWDRRYKNLTLWDKRQLNKGVAGKATPTIHISQKQWEKSLRNPFK